MYVMCRQDTLSGKDFHVEKSSIEAVRENGLWEH